MLGSVCGPWRIWVANGDLKSVGFFGTLAVLALPPRRADSTSRTPAARPREFAPFELATSNPAVPGDRPAAASSFGHGR